MTYQVEPDPFPRRKEIPLRAIGGNVLLRKVAMDAHTCGLVIYNGGQNKVLQIAEVVGLGGRWTQNRPWQPPMPAPRRPLMPDGSPDMSWKPPDLSRLPQPQPARFGEGHKAWLEDLKVGDLVVYTQARTYDVFPWDGEDILVHPGDWLHGRIEDSTLAEHPELRRYIRDEFNTEAADYSVAKGTWMR